MSETTPAEQPPASRRHIFVDWLLLVVALIMAGWVTHHQLTKPPVATVFIPSLSPIKVGQTQTLPVFIDTHGLTINAAEVYLSFDRQAFKVTDTGKAGSFFQIWIKDQPAFNNEQGEISFAGGLPRPGFKGRGQVGTVTITGAKASTSQLKFTGRTQVLLNDGQGTSVPLKLEPVTIEVKP